MTTSNCKHPLRVRFDKWSWQYKVNKPEIEDGWYVDKGVADAMLAALIDIREYLVSDDPRHDLTKVNEAIKLATKSWEKQLDYLIRQENNK